MSPVFSMHQSLLVWSLSKDFVGSLEMLSHHFGCEFSSAYVHHFPLWAKGNCALNLDICHYTEGVLACAPLFPSLSMMILFAEAFPEHRLEDQLVPLIIWQGNPPQLLSRVISVTCAKRTKCSWCNCKTNFHMRLQLSPLEVRWGQ